MLCWVSESGEAARAPMGRERAKEEQREGARSKRDHDVEIKKSCDPRNPHKVPSPHQQYAFFCDELTLFSLLSYPPPSHSFLRTLVMMLMLKHFINVLV